MAPKKKCSCCECKKKNKEKDCSQYPAGIQKEDLLWAYFVMRMICGLMSDPAVVFRKRPGQKKKKKGKKGAEPLVRSFDLAMMCNAMNPPGEFQKNVDVTRAAETRAQEELARLAEEEDRKEEEARKKREEEEERKRKEAEEAVAAGMS